MGALRVFGSVGKATTRIMVDAILESTGVELDPAVLVLLDSDDEGLRALAVPNEDIVVANADWVPSRLLPASAVTFGLGDAAGLWASELDATLDGTWFTLRVDGKQRRVALRLLGEHQVPNALAAIAVAVSVGIAVDDAISALEGLATLGRGRMERLQGAGGATIINDAVSAEPQSVAAALKALAQVAGSRRSVAVLGELSLDDDDPQDARAAHDRIGRLIVRLNVKKLVVVGHRARHIHNAAGLEGSWDGESVLVDTVAEAYDLLRDELRQQDVVLVKSSEDAGLDVLVDRLVGVAR